MADRTMIWHIPKLPVAAPVYYADRDYVPAALRLHAERAPDGDMKVDILDDGVSIMNANTRQTMTFRSENAYIEYRTLATSTFQVNETVTGATSGATAKVEKSNTGQLVLYDPSATAFTVDETITGGTSNATAIVTAYVRQRKEYTPGTVAGTSRAVLPKGKNSNEAAQDFRQGAEVKEGSWVSLSLLDAAGAGNITVQLELDALGVSVESRPWAE